MDDRGHGWIIFADVASMQTYWVSFIPEGDM